MACSLKLNRDKQENQNRPEHMSRTNLAASSFLPDTPARTIPALEQVRRVAARPANP